MDQLWEVAARDMESNSAGERGMFGDDPDAEEEVEDEEDEEEDEEGGEMGASEEDEQQEGGDDERPVKRLRGKQPLMHLQSAIARGLGGGSAAGTGAGSPDDPKDNMAEVIEILSDDDDAHSFHCGMLGDFEPTRLSSQADLPGSSSVRPAQVEAGQAMSRASVAARPAWAAGLGSDQKRDSGRTQRNRSSECRSRPGQGRLKVEFGAATTVTKHGVERGAVSSFVAPPVGSGPPRTLTSIGDRAEDGKPSAEEKAGAEGGWAGWIAAANSENAPTVAAAAGAPAVAAIAKKSAATTINSTINTSTAELHRSLECPMCFNPLAVVALFACGHGSCWECAHDWCSRGTSSIMDCPTCHVSVPRNDFRRCIALDEAVERAVIAADAFNGDEWENRIARGQKLAREAEAGRRSAGDAQRTLETTIALQAEELERLREEARPRGAGRWRRPAEAHSAASVADYRIRLLSGRDGAADSETHRAIEEFTNSIRHRAVDMAERSGARGGSASAAAAAAAAADAAAATALGMRPSGSFGVVRSRPQASSASAGGTLAREDPWFSLRPTQWNRQSGVAMSTGRAGREAFGRSSASGRSTGASAAAGPEPHMGAVLQSAAERDGADWRGAYFNVSRSSRAAPTGDNSFNHQNLLLSGSRARSSDATSLSINPPPGFGIASAAGPAGLIRRPAAHTPRARSSRKKCTSRGLHAAAAAAEPRATASAGSASTPYSTAGVAASAASEAPYGFVRLGSTGATMQRDRSSNAGIDIGVGGSGRTAATGAAAVGSAGSRFDEGDSDDLEPLDVISRHNEFGTTRSEWDDVLAAVSLPHETGNDGLRRAEPADGGQH